MSLIEQQQEYATNANQIERLEMALTLIEARQKVLDPIIREGMIEADQQNARYHGRTIAIRRTVYASAIGGREAAAEALKAVGLGDLVTPNFNTNTVSAVFRNWDKAEQDGVLAPEDAAKRDALKGVAFNVGEKFQLVATK